MTSPSHRQPFSQTIDERRSPLPDRVRGQILEQAWSLIDKFPQLSSEGEFQALAATIMALGFLDSTYQSVVRSAASEREIRDRLSAHLDEQSFSQIESYVLPALQILVSHGYLAEEKGRFLPVASVRIPLGAPSAAFLAELEEVHRGIARLHSPANPIATSHVALPSPLPFHRANYPFGCHGATFDFSAWIDHEAVADRMRIVHDGIVPFRAREMLQGVLKGDPPSAASLGVGQSPGDVHARLRRFVKRAVLDALIEEHAATEGVSAGALRRPAGTILQGTTHTFTFIDDGGALEVRLRDHTDPPRHIHRIMIVQRGSSEQAVVFSWPDDIGEIDFAASRVTWCRAVGEELLGILKRKVEVTHAMVITKDAFDYLVADRAPRVGLARTFVRDLKDPHHYFVLLDVPSDDLNFVAERLIERSPGSFIQEAAPVQAAPATLTLEQRVDADSRYFHAPILMKEVLTNGYKRLGLHLNILATIADRSQSWIERRGGKSPELHVSKEGQIARALFLVGQSLDNAERELSRPVQRLASMMRLLTGTEQPEFITAVFDRILRISSPTSVQDLATSPFGMLQFPAVFLNRLVAEFESLLDQGKTIRIDDAKQALERVVRSEL